LIERNTFELDANPLAALGQELAVLGADAPAPVAGVVLVVLEACLRHDHTSALYRWRE
jgi:hypothetical protein